MKSNAYYSQTVDEVLEALGSNYYGLDSQEVKKRLVQYGHNELPEAKRDGFLRLFFSQFKSPLIYLLLFSGLIVWLMGDRIDAAVIFFVLFFNATIGTVQEGRAQNTFLALRNLVKGRAIVLRDGAEMNITDRDLVPGDIVVLREGEKVPADGRVILAQSLAINEAALTGESIPKFKLSDSIASVQLELADQRNMVFKGTTVFAGNGRVVVTKTGMKTYLGGIAKETLTVGSDFPLKNDIQILSRFIILTVACLSFVIFFFSLASGVSYREAFKIVVAISVSVIPEGLPIVMTLVLAAGVWRMGQQKILVKKLQAVEVLGETKVIAVDKTGTVTKNELVVRRVYSGGLFFEVDGLGYDLLGEVRLEGKKIDPLNHPELILAGKIAALEGNVSLIFNKKTHSWKLAGDPTEGAMLVFSKKIGFHRDDLLVEWPLLEEVPFDYELKFRASLHQEKKKNFLAVAGSPENILALSDWEMLAEKRQKLSNSRRNDLQKILDAFSAEGMRVVAFAYAEIEGEDIQKHALPSLVFGGFFGIRDELRPGVRAAVERFGAAGIRIVMITGDHELTAIAIAREAGIYREGDKVLSGSQIEKLDADALCEAISGVSVFARVAPKHKLRIIQAYKENGIVVAMTGDGVNDALSLTAADIGISMGKIGTETAKEASDIVLLDDNFERIIYGVKEGRHIVKTMKKVVLYLLSTSLGEIMVILGALVLKMPLPILAVQILWLNLVTDGFLDLALSMDPKDDKTDLARNGYPRKNIFLDKLMLQRMLVMALPMMFGTLFLFERYYALGDAKAWTISLTTLAIFQWLNVWNCRSTSHSIVGDRFFSNKFLLGAMLVVISLHLLAVYNPFLQLFLKTVPLAFSDWVLVITVAFSIVIVEEGRKFLLRRKFERKSNLAI